MKNAALLLAVLFYSQYVCGQEFREDERDLILKEDPSNLLASESIETIDLLQALEFSGVTVNKFDLGEFVKEYKLNLIIEKYTKGVKESTDTIYTFKNTYRYYPDEPTKSYFDYLPEIKIFTETEENQSKVQIQTYSLSLIKKLQLAKTDPNQFFKWKSYNHINWELNKSVPLMVFASSWLDPSIGFQRFCGVDKLTIGEEQTKELLQESPEYYVLIYAVSNISN